MSGKPRILSPEEKLRAVHDYLEGDFSVCGVLYFEKGSFLRAGRERR